MAEVLFRSFTPDLEVRSGGDGRTVAGIAVPYGQVQDIDPTLTEEFVRGAFNHQLGAIHRVKAYRDHSVHGGTLIGAVRSARDDAAGLYAEFRVAPTVAGDETLALIRDGALDELSIGFRERAGGSQYVRGVTRRTSADLTEIAIVPQGAYGRGAVISGVRSVNGCCAACGAPLAGTRSATPTLDEARALLPTLTFE